MEPVPAPWELSYFRSLVPERSAGSATPRLRVDLAPLSEVWAASASSVTRGELWGLLVELPWGYGPWLTLSPCAVSAKARVPMMATAGSWH